MPDSSSGPTAGSTGGTGAGPQVTRNNPFAGLTEGSGSGSATSESTPTPAAAPAATPAAPAASPSTPSAPTVFTPAPPPPAHIGQLYQNGTPPATAPATTPVTSPAGAPAADPNAAPAGAPQLALTAEMADRLAQSVAQGLAQHQQSQQQQQQQQVQQQQQENEFHGWTAEQMEQYFSVPRVTEEQVATIFRGGTEAVNVLNNLLHSAGTMGSKIAVWRADKLVKEAVAGIRAELARDYGPAREYAREAEMQRHTEAFYTKYPELKNPAYNETLLTVYQHLQASGFKGPPEEVYQKVADEAKRLITGILPNAFTSGASHTTTQQGQQRSSMATMPSPGGGGSNNASHQSAGGKTTAERLFG